MKDSPLEHTSNVIESQIKYMREKIDDIHEMLKMVLQSHAEEKIMSVKGVAGIANYHNLNLSD